MKVAALISGQIRDGVSVFEGVKNFLLNDINPDVYIHSYNCDQSKQIIELYNPKKYILEDQNKNNLEKDTSKYTNKAPETNVYNCLNMWRKRKLNFEALDGCYDIIFVSRFDSYICEASLKDYLFKDSLNIPERGDCGGINDLMAWGSYEDMKYYTSLYDKIDEYYNRGVRFHPETLLSFHLRQNSSLKLNRVSVKVKLRDHIHNRIENP